MRQIFNSINDEQFFRQNGYVVFDLLDEAAINTILDFYKAEFKGPREVFPFAQNLPYYISIFDCDHEHKRKADRLISTYVRQGVNEHLEAYEVFYSNFMIKFPGDGQIEAHQDFNFVDESIHTAFNLWSPLVDTDAQNGGLFVIPGSHNVFKTQRGPTLPRALTQYNQLMKKYACPIPLRKGQAIVFDHKLIHYSPPNYSNNVRVAIQAVLKPNESPACHFHFDEATQKVKAYRINRNFIFENDLWKNEIHRLPLDHEEELIPFPDEKDVMKNLVQLKVAQIKKAAAHQTSRPVFKDHSVQQSFSENGFVKLSLLQPDEVQQLKDLFVNYSGGNVQNTDYGMYISLEEKDVLLKKKLVQEISATVLPRVNEHFNRCKPHLGSFLVKAPGENSFTYPHQDWTFVDSPEYNSITVWIALVDTNEANGTLGFVNGSHRFFNSPVGSPSPDFTTCTQGHEAIFYEYLEFVSLKAGEAIAFDNGTIHGASPNTTQQHRIAVAIGMTPDEAPLYHWYLVPGSVQNGHRKMAKLKVDDTFFHRHTVAYLKQLYDLQKMPEGYEEERILHDEFIPFSGEEIRLLCEECGLKKNGRQLRFSQPAKGQGQRAPGRNKYRAIAAKIKHYFFKS